MYISPCDISHLRARCDESLQIKQGHDYLLPVSLSVALACLQYQPGNEVSLCLPTIYRLAAAAAHDDGDGDDDDDDYDDDDVHGWVMYTKDGIRGGHPRRLTAH